MQFVSLTRPFFQRQFKLISLWQQQQCTEAPFCTQTASTPSSSAAQTQHTENKAEPPKDSSSGSSTGGGGPGKNWKLGLAMLGGTAFVGFGVLFYNYGPPLLDENGKEIVDQFSHLSAPLAYFRRTVQHCSDFNQTIKAPISEKLLPDPPPPPYYQPKYTLVLEVNGILLHPDWTFRSGWRYQKRPALELFLQQVSTCFEVVVFTEDSMFTMATVLERLDNEGRLLHHRLFREATRFEKGQHIKDLSCLNRDLSKVIMIDWNPKAVQLQPRNALHLNKWEGDEEDRMLIDLAAFLRMIFTSGVDDVRPVLDYYKTFDDPIAVFKENQEKVLELQSKKEKSPTSLAGRLNFLKQR